MGAALEIDAPPFKYPIGICSICVQVFQVSPVSQVEPQSESSRNELNALTSDLAFSLSLSE